MMVKFERMGEHVRQKPDQVVHRVLVRPVPLDPDKPQIAITSTRIPTRTGGGVRLIQLFGVRRKALPEPETSI